MAHRVATVAPCPPPPPPPYVSVNQEPAAAMDTSSDSSDDDDTASVGSASTYTSVEAYQADPRMPTMPLDVYLSRRLGVRRWYLGRAMCHSWGRRAVERILREMPLFSEWDRHHYVPRSISTLNARSRVGRVGWCYARHMATYHDYYMRYPLWPLIELEDGALAAVECMQRPLRRGEEAELPPTYRTRRPPRRRPTRRRRRHDTPDIIPGDPAPGDAQVPGESAAGGVSRPDSVS